MLEVGRGKSRKQGSEEGKNGCTTLKGERYASRATRQGEKSRPDLRHTRTLRTAGIAIRYGIMLPARLKSDCLG
jgi:hypothetical protein